MSSGLDYAIGRGCREQSRSNWSYCVHTANMRLLRVWRDFHSGKIRGALYWKLGDGADCFDKFEPFAKLLSRKERISSPCDKPHTGSIRLLELEEYLKPKQETSRTNSLPGMKNPQQHTNEVLPGTKTPHVAGSAFLINMKSRL